MNKTSAICALLLFLCVGAFAQTETLPWSFSYSNGDGANPWGNYLISDSKGNLYGVTEFGGSNNTGMIFELSPNMSGGYNESILYQFNYVGSGDGALPYGGMVLDKRGNLYGTTYTGGVNGTGTVWELMYSNKKYAEKVLHSFGPVGGLDGKYPLAGLAIDTMNHLYGTTYYGGAHLFYGTVFKLSRTAGHWKETIVHSFSNNGDGYYPYGGVMLDSLGNLYGTTSLGGSRDGGTVYELKKAGKGWTESLLYSFCSASSCNDGVKPYFVNLVTGNAGNIYGTTVGGGLHQGGVVFELSPGKSGGYSESVLYAFCAQNGCSDGTLPSGGVVFDAEGNLYGTTAYGGSGGGVVYELSPTSGGGWTETVIHSFTGATDGAYPSGNLLLDALGSAYGMGEIGGLYGFGVVFEVTP
jgi:uncharacterized repeat protein (TIGR03803 family)